MAKKKEIYFGKGFKRIYFTASGIWMVSWVIIMFQDAQRPTYSGVMHDVIIPGLIFGLWPIPLYFILLFFIKGFRK